MIACPSVKCLSPNVADLPHYWASLPADSPLKGRYAPPEVPQASYWLPLAAVAVGVLLLVGGSLAGLLVIAGAGAWGALAWRSAQQVEAKRTAWETSHVCLACTGTF
ncbi:hypothetical protein TPA0906_66250 [Streptomyces olivaceus]|nr:hypothetical protein TPA0906_66250 [Streptomyces olivaceus]